MSHRRSRCPWAAVALVALAALAAHACSGEVAAPPPPPPPKVTVVFPEVRTVATEDEFDGWTAAVESVDVRARVRGHIDTVHFVDGDIVRAGDPLFTLDVRPFEADLAAAEAGKRVFEAQLVAARREQVRLEELLGKGGASQKQVDKAQADVGALEAQIAAAQSEIERRALDLEYARITAPIAGRLSRALLTEGNLVGAGGADPLLTTIVSVDPIHVYFDVPERSVLDYRVRAQARDPGFALDSPAARAIPFRFGLENDDGLPREGVLDFVENQVDAGTGTLRVRGRAANPDGLLVPGARVRVRLVTGEPVERVLVPDQALLADQHRRYVLVVGPDDTVLRKDVRPGRLLDDGLRVLLPQELEEPDDAVQPTDRVIVEGQARARIHDPVEALDADGEPVTPRAAPRPRGGG